MLSLPKNTKEHNFQKKIEASRFPFSSQQTLYLFKKGLSIKEIADRRIIKESTVWEHLATLVEYNQLSVWKVLPKETISRVLRHIKTEDDRLVEIKQRMNDPSITFNEIACVLAHLRCKNRHINQRKK